MISLPSLIILENFYGYHDNMIIFLTHFFQFFICLLNAEREDVYFVSIKKILLGNVLHR